MATMDLLNHQGGAPANFLDVGGSANTKAITAAFEIINTDAKVVCLPGVSAVYHGLASCHCEPPNCISSPSLGLQVKSVFVNIFGGIMSCKTIAAGMVEALNNVEVKVPIVVRLMGIQSTTPTTLATPNVFVATALHQLLHNIILSFTTIPR